MPQYQKTICVLLTLIFTACSSGVTHLPDKGAISPEFLFTDFTPNQNYQLKIKYDLPNFSGKTKKQANDLRKKALTSALKEAMGIVYMLPQDHKFLGKGINGLNSCKPQRELHIKHYGKVCEELSYRKTINPADLIKKYTDETGEDPPYKIYYHDTDDRKSSRGHYHFHVKNEESSPYFLKKAGAYSVVLSRKYPEDLKITEQRKAPLGYFSNIEDQHFKPPMFEYNLLTHRYRKDDYVRASMFRQYIARKKSPLGFIPLVSASKELNNFVNTHTIPVTSKERFVSNILRPIYDKVEALELHWPKGLHSYQTFLYRNTALFFREFNYLEGFREITQHDFQTFLKDAHKRQRMFGLLFLAYSEISYEEIDKETLEINIQVNIEKMFRDFDFEKISKHMEK